MLGTIVLLVILSGILVFKAVTEPKSWPLQLINYIFKISKLNLISMH
jgi:hypothetical protein